MRVLLETPPKHVERGKVRRYLLTGEFGRWKSLVGEGRDGE